MSAAPPATLGSSVDPASNASAPAPATTLGSGAGPASSASSAPALSADVQRTATETQSTAVTSGATTAGQTLLSDTFDSGSARDWAPASGTWSLCKRPLSSYEYCAKATSENATFAGFAWTNYTASAYVYMNAFPSGRSGMDIVVRAQDANHFYELELVNEYDKTQQWEIWRNDGGAWQNLARGYFAFRSGDHDILRMAAIDSHLTASISRDHGASFTTLGTATDTRFSSGKIGLRAWGGLTGTFDNVLVTSGGTSATPSPTSAPSSSPTLAPKSTTVTFPQSPLRRTLTTIQNDPNDAAWRAAQNGSFRDLEFNTDTTVKSNDYTTPVYQVSTSDIPHVVHCSLYACPGEEGTTVYLPRGAKPEGGSDGHVAIVNRGQNREDDLWLVRSIDDTWGSRIDTGHAGSCKLDGDGTSCGGTSSNLPLSLGMLRESDLVNGTITSALQVGLNCASPAHIYPATGSDGNNWSCPPLGTHGYLDYTDAQIDATSNPSWAKHFWKALDRQHYGFFAADTGAGAGYSIGQVESDNSYTVIGQSGPWHNFYNGLLGSGLSGFGIYSGIAHVQMPQAGLDIPGHTHFLKAGL